MIHGMSQIKKTKDYGTVCSKELITIYLSENNWANIDTYYHGFREFCIEQGMTKAQVPASNYYRSMKSLLRKCRELAIENK